MKNLLVGLVLTALGAWGLVTWWSVFGFVMRGLVPFLLLLVGLIAIFAGYRKTASQERRVETAPDNGKSVDPIAARVASDLGAQAPGDGIFQ